MNSVVNNLYTTGNELLKSNGEFHIGYYHISNTGALFTQAEFVEGVSEPLSLYTAMSENSVGQLLSEYDEEFEGYDGVYTVIPVKNYKNDIDIAQEIVDLAEPEPITITEQPDIFFSKITEDVSVPGQEVFIDDANTIRVLKGSIITLQFGYQSVDNPANISFQWFDSFDRPISTDYRLVLDTATIEAEEETFFCTVTDSYGSDTTNVITIAVIDPENNPFILTNILSNGSGNEGLADWDSVGDAPEEVGKFLPEYEQDEIPDIVFGLQAGTRFYHKFNSGPDGRDNKNQWYPRPQDFDYINGFNGTVEAEIKDNYFRGGVFFPVVRRNENNHNGTTKNSTQIIDLTEFADAIDGKIYGLVGFHAVMFGWLGGRADQADRANCEFEFLDENDEIIDVNGIRKIENADWYLRTTNEYQPPNLTAKRYKVHAGYRKVFLQDTDRVFIDYTGIYKDGNIGVDFRRYELNSTLSDGSLRTVTPVVKTLIIGKTTDMISVPPGTRKIRVTKTYYHIPGTVDLIWNGDAWADEGNEYTSDALIAGLNVRLYPITVSPDQSTIIETGFDEDGSSVIKFMDFLNEKADDDLIAELEQILPGIEGGTQYYDGQELRFDPISPVKVLNITPSTKIFDFTLGTQGYTKNLPIPALGDGWNVYTNEALRDFISAYWPEQEEPEYNLLNKLNKAAPEGLGTLNSSLLQLSGAPGVDSLLLISNDGIITINA